MNLSETEILKFNEYLRTSKRFAITAHVHPDGDAVGSTCAMKSFIGTVLGKEARIVLPDPAPVTLSFLADKFEIESGQEAAKDAFSWCDTLICLDFNTLSRLGELESAAQESKAHKILIDHHLNPEAGNFDLVISEIAISSASELLFHTLKRLPEIDGCVRKLPSDCTYALMTGMTTDTNNFANSVYPSTLRMASELLEAGVDRDEIIQRIYNDGREERVRAWTWLLSNKLRIHPEGFAYIVMTAGEKEFLGTVEGELEGLVNIPLQIKTVRVSAFLREMDGYFQISLRSKPGTIVNTLAKEKFHGGGHAQASGGRVYFPDDISDKEDISQYFEEAAAQFMHRSRAAME